jgi:hypothetical protein
MVARVTFDDATAGDMTFLDSPLQLGFSAADDGKLKLKTDLYSGFIDPCFLAFAPPCATIAFRSIGIVDPDGRLFATLGSSSR